MPLERKSVEPTAAVMAPARVAAKHQPLPHFVGQASWSDEALMAQVRDHVLPIVERQGPIQAWIVDDTGFPQKGCHSVGVAGLPASGFHFIRQSCKRTNTKVCHRLITLGFVGRPERASSEPPPNGPSL